ncbi:hypothetical protein [Paenibacillus aceris]|uniref:DUF2642 domain-containing protein n=1 Tax=Paenibacillus aceris TaxID=869555 RepID=A0ABS4I1D9_9BACL|nr:hypothetical protein [Paenibacillus aceris]MBP1964732.1 hypothetical protein [Paenibacillus aceris]NHW33717.1 hypothetical protein [Paenibacillus aceris]
MYMNPSQHPGHHGPQMIYQAEPNWQHQMRHKRDMIMGALHPHVGRTIRVTTIDGHTFEGVLINVDGHHAHLQISGHHHDHLRPIYTPAQYNQILTLVLFELLVILLLA